MAKRIPYIPNRVIDTNGISDGASIYVYETGTTTPVAIYSDETLLTPLANPYVVAAGAAVGEIYHAWNRNVRVRVVADGGTVISDDDPFKAPVTDADLASTDAGKGAGLVGVEGGGNVQGSIDSLTTTISNMPSSPELIAAAEAAGLAGAQPAVAAAEGFRDEAEQITAQVSAALAVGTVSDLVGTRIYESKAALDADLVPADGEYALVVGDAAPDNNDLYRKSGATTAGSWVGPLGFLAAASAQANAAKDAAEAAVAGNTQANIWVDPFFRYTEVGEDAAGRQRWRSSSNNGFSSVSLANNPTYPGHVLRKTDPGTTQLAGPLLWLDEIFASPGDTITLRALVTGQAGKTALGFVRFYTEANAPSGGGVVDSDYSMRDDASAVGVVLSATVPARLNATLTVPAGAAAVAVYPYSTTIDAGNVVDVHALWGYKGAALDGPDMPTIGDEAFAARAILGLPNIPAPQFVGTPDQLFDAASVVAGYEVYNDGRLLVQANSSYALLYVGDYEGSTLAVSGLQPATTPRYYNFHSALPTVADPTGAIASKIAGGSFPETGDGGTIVVPSGALWLALSPKQRNADPADYGDVVVLVGDVPASAPVAFSPRVGLIDGVPIKSGGGNGSTPNYAGGVGFALGDSITETTDVDSGSHLYPTGFRANWPDYAIPKIAPDAFYSFAKSGAHFATIAALTSNQKFENQITAAVNYATANTLTPRWLIVSLGTNDWSSSITLPSGYGGLGDHATAMGKSLTFDGSGNPTTTLDNTVSLEAMRLGFARLRWHFADTVMFCALPLQRADYTSDQMLAWVDAIDKMARTYGFEVIDCFGESGVLKEFEVVSGAGRDLYDGLHPDASGQAKQGKTIAPQIMSRLMA